MSTLEAKEMASILDAFQNESKRVYSYAYSSGYFAFMIVDMLKSLPADERNRLRSIFLKAIEELKCK